MQEKTYKFISQNIEVLDVDLEKGIINNRKPFNMLGYVGISLKSKGVKVHQVIAVMLWGNSCIGKQVNHIDGNKTNNRPCNLELVTPSENNKHAYTLGLRISEKGSKNHFAKLNEDDVKAIKKLLNDGVLNGVEIGKKFGVSKHTISLIRRNKTWRHVI